MGKKNKKPKIFHTRPAWVVRLSATFLDLGLCISVVAVIYSNLVSAISIPIIVAFYYWACEFFFGRTLGKVILRMKITDKVNNLPTRLRLGMRTLLRLILPPVMVLSWKRVSLLDLLSGCRVVKLDIKPLEGGGTKPFPSEPVVGWR